MTDITALITCMTDKERPFIDATLKSVMYQTLPCKTIVLLNEASDQFNDLEAAYPFARFIRTKIRPPGAMRNFGLQFVETKWVAFCDGDDVWLPRKLEKQHQLIADEDVDLVGTDSVLINEGGVKFAYAMSHVIPAPSSWFASTEIMRRCPFEETLFTSKDCLWWSTYARGADSVRTLRLSEFLLEYRVRGSSLSSVSAPGKRKRVFKRIAESSGVARRSVMLMTWLLSRVLVRRQYKASLFPSP